jgi:hypothetical protein
MCFQFNMLNIYHPHGCHWKGTTILWWDACYYYLGFALLCTTSDNQLTSGQNINIFKIYLNKLFF